MIREDLVQMYRDWYVCVYVYMRVFHLYVCPKDMIFSYILSVHMYVYLRIYDMLHVTRKHPCTKVYVRAFMFVCVHMQTVCIHVCMYNQHKLSYVHNGPNKPANIHIHRHRATSTTVFYWQRPSQFNSY
jgi:hypothetical protein